MLILIEFITFVGYQTLIGQFHITLIGVLLMNGMKPETFFLQVSTYSKVRRSFRRKQIGDVHHHFCLCIRFQHIQHIVAYNSIKLPFWIIWAIIIIIAHYVIALTLQIIRVETKTAAEIQYFPL